MENNTIVSQEKLNEYISLCEEVARKVTEIQKQDWSLETFRRFCSQHNIPFQDNQYIQCHTQISNIKSINFSLLLEKLQKAMLFGKRLNHDTALSQYNATYITHITLQAVTRHLN